MVLRVTVYGWMIPDDRLRGPGSGTFVDMTYFLDGDITVAEVWRIISDSGFKPLPFRYPKGHPLEGDVVKDKITIEEIDIGFEEVPEEEVIDYTQGQQYPY